MRRVKTKLPTCLLSLLLLGACSTIERGVVVRKGHTIKSSGTETSAFYWVDVRGKQRDGDLKTERVPLFKRDWERFRKGDVITPHDFDMLGATAGLRASVKKIAKLGSTPPPATPKARTRPTPVRSKAPPPAPTPKAGAPKPSAETEAAREARFRNVEARAHADAGIRELKLKIHDAKTNEEQAAAWQEHRRALYQKMRELEPSLKDRIDQAETSGR